MFGFFGSNRGLRHAEANLLKEFALPLSKVPGNDSVKQLFESMTKESKFSEEAQCALFYRLVVFNYLAAFKIMRDNGQTITLEEVLWLPKVLDASVTWSEKSSDRVQLEQVTSQLNRNIIRFLESFGIRRG